MNYSIKELTGNHVQIVPMERRHTKGLWEAGAMKISRPTCQSALNKMPQEMSQLVEDAL
ncbi:hypothetical protein L2D08_18760 [Domibacillus sp. PGB-M46]|uniref:hypothetical protein n=1 Tax=Domibacillus sp. PGB-M46 TaxID=2910255 RepID=UPI001F5832AE|nr:hypothetical protein [Domibacillus sp. PGB-M46]MCI2256388.1 hypothetical protein [Domibacillus sp. PGB-M46]